MALAKKVNEQFKPLSMVQYFEPPENYVGSFGWVCGYSATPEFLNLAAERFTFKTKIIRARDGAVNMILMLDKGNPQISMLHVPGVFHAGRDENKQQPFRLLHAKLALLCFKNIKNPKKVHIRLLVSTGNWTMETLSESLDLVCCLDLSSEDFISTNEYKRQIRADIIAAWDLLKYVRNYFPYSIVVANKDKETFIAYQSFENIMQSVQKPRASVPGFFDNRNFSLLEQLPALIKTTPGNRARNYLALGSGFFQKPHSSRKIPSVIDRIFKSLVEAGLLIHNPGKELFIVPEACQAVAHSIEDLIEHNWIIREAIDPLGKKRTLHAKFIFSAIYRQGYNLCNSAWLYVGSGNLTESGFTNKISSINGNLEAGIIINPPQLSWKYLKGLDHHFCVDKILPLNWDHDLQTLLKGMVHAGSDMPERDEDYKAAPISWFNWIDKDRTGILEPNTVPGIQYQLITPDNIPCIKDEEDNWLWNYDQPAMVEVRWGDKLQLSNRVPIIDSFGRIAAKQLSAIGIDEAWWQLDSYPGFNGEEDDDEDDQNLPIDTDSQMEVLTRKGSVRTQSYSIRQMMELVENVADKQTAIPKTEWKIWCDRLEQNLIQTKGSEVYELFKKMQINPMSPLRKEPFRPSYAIDNNTEEGLYYEKVLDKIEIALDLVNLASI